MSRDRQGVWAVAHALGSRAWLFWISMCMEYIAHAMRLLAELVKYCCKYIPQTWPDFVSEEVQSGGLDSMVH